MRRYQVVIDVTGSVGGIYALIIYLKVEIWSGVTDASQTDSLTDFER